MAQYSMGRYDPVWYRDWSLTSRYFFIDKTKEFKIIDFIKPEDVQMNKQEIGKIEKYKVLKPPELNSFKTIRKKLFVHKQEKTYSKDLLHKFPTANKEL